MSTPPTAPPEGPRARDQILAAVALAGVVAWAALRAVAGAAFETMQRARTPGERAVAYGAVTGIFAWFLPWLTILGRSRTGVGMAGSVTGLLWVMPLSLLAVFVLAHRNQDAPHRLRALRARWFLVVGTSWTVASAGVILAGRKVTGVSPRIGLYVLVAGALAVAVGGFLTMGASVARIAEGRERE